MFYDFVLSESYAQICQTNLFGFFFFLSAICLVFVL